MSARPDMRGPLPISVVIPVYNGADFLAEALDSIRGQTRCPAEVIVVDDGSTDDSAAIANAWGARVIRRPHQGPSASRNAAIREATQPWIAFLDGDDLWKPTKLARQWVAIERCSDVGLVFTDCSLFSSEGTLVESFLGRRKNYAGIERRAYAPDTMLCAPESLRWHFIRGNFIQPSTAIVRRDLLLQVGLFDTALTKMEDRELWLRLLPVCRVAVVERPLMRSRVHDHNASSDLLGMSLAATVVAERVFAHPERYPAGAEGYYRAALPSLFLDCGRYADHAGDIPSARTYYRRSWRAGGGLRPLVLYALCGLPGWVRTVARAVMSTARSLRPRSAT